jgi:hypothetical protein
MESTIIKMDNLTKSQPGIDVLTNVKYPDAGVTLKDMTVIMPRYGVSGDAVLAGSGVKLENFRFGGGNKDTWGVHFINPYNPVCVNVKSVSTQQGSPGDPMSNGIWVHQDPTGKNYEEVHYGDGYFSNIDIMGLTDGFTGIKFTGAIFDMLLERLIVVGLNRTGVGLDSGGLYYSMVNQFDFENLNTCIRLNKGWGVKFSSYYMEGNKLVDYIGGDKFLFEGMIDPKVNSPLVTWKRW